MKINKTIQSFRAKLSQITHKLLIKAMLICLLISLFPFGIISYITYKSTLKILIAEYTDSSRKTLAQGSKVIENHFQQLQDIAASPYKDTQFLLNLTDREDKFLKLSYNESFLKDMFFYNDYIESIYFYTAKGGILYYYPKHHSSHSSYRAVENESWYKKTINNVNGFYISAADSFKNYHNMHKGQNKPLYSINQSIINIETKEVLAVITLNISKNKIDDFSKSIKDENEGILILNSSGEILFRENLSMDIYQAILSQESVFSYPNSFLKLNVLNHRYILIYSHFLDGMILAKVISYRQFEKEAVSSISGILKSALIIFLAVLVLSIIFFFKLASFIQMMEASLKRINKGDFDINMTYSGNDEMSKFINNFNTMAQKINYLINSEYKSKIALKNAQIMALQTQINPHFMYNSLQAVSTLALRGHSAEIYKMLRAIADLLKYSLGKKDCMVSLETEIEHIQNYLYIQESRFGAKLEVSYHLDDEVSDVKLPRLLLQPLVENSLTYGHNGINIIKIVTEREEDFCRIVIQDNGRGISTEMLRKIDCILEDKDYLLSDQDHIGLRNVISRIRLIYNDQARISIASRLGEGTKISIKIPFVEGRQQNV